VTWSWPQIVNHRTNYRFQRCPIRSRKVNVRLLFVWHPLRNAANPTTHHRLLFHCSALYPKSSAPTGSALRANLPPPRNILIPSLPQLLGLNSLPFKVLIPLLPQSPRKDRRGPRSILFLFSSQSEPLIRISHRRNLFGSIDYLPT